MIKTRSGFSNNFERILVHSVEKQDAGTPHVTKTVLMAIWRILT